MRGDIFKQGVFVHEIYNTLLKATCWFSFTRVSEWMSLHWTGNLNFLTSPLQPYAVTYLMSLLINSV